MEKTRKNKSLGYKCAGCGEKFLYSDFSKDYEALEAAFSHIEEEHNTSNSVETIHDPDT